MNRRTWREFFAVVGPSDEFNRLRESDTALHELDCLVNQIIRLADGQGEGRYFHLDSMEWNLIRRLARASMLALGVEAAPPVLGFDELCAGAISQGDDGRG